MDVVVRDGRLGGQNAPSKCQPNVFQLVYIEVKIKRKRFRGRTKKPIIFYRLKARGHFSLKSVKICYFLDTSLNVVGEGWSPWRVKCTP